MLWICIACSSPQPFLKDGPFPAQVKAESRVGLHLLFICTAENKSVFLLFDEIPGHSLLWLQGTFPPIASGLLLGEGLAAQKDMDLAASTNTEVERESLGAGRAARGTETSLARSRSASGYFLPQGLCCWSFAIRCWCTPAAGRQNSGAVQGAEENGSNSLFLSKFIFSLHLVLITS